MKGLTITKAQVESIFSSEDAVNEFKEMLDRKQMQVLYEVLYYAGCRYTGRALEDMRRERKW